MRSSKSKLSTIIATVSALMDGPYTESIGIKPKRPKKVWNAELKCYTINGKPIEKEVKEAQDD